MAKQWMHLAALFVLVAPAAAQSKGVWEPVNYSEDVELNGVFFVTVDEGWVTGGVGIGGGVLLHTTDAGAHWDVVLGDPAGNQRPFYNPRFVDQLTGFVAQGKQAGDHVLLRTIDGANWQVVGTVPQHHQDYRFFSATVGVAAYSSELRRTTDAGKTWEKVFDCSLKAQVDGLTRTVRCEVSAFHFPSATVGYALGSSPDARGIYVLRTDDAGATWTVWLASSDDDGREGHIFFTNEQTGYICTAGGRFFGTTDGGQTWTGLPGAECEGKAPILFADPEVGWTLRYNHLTYTVDGGRRWVGRQLALPASAAAFSLPRRDRAYAVGDHGMIYRYSVVPIATPVAKAIAAPAMPAFTTPLDDRVLDLQQSVGAIATGLQGDSSGASMQPAVATPAAAGSDPTSVFVTRCCGRRLSTAQATLTAVGTLLPAFLAKYRNLNVVAQGLRAAVALPQMNDSLQAALKAFRSATDQTSATAALAQVQSLLAGLKAVVDTAVQGKQ